MQAAVFFEHGGIDKLQLADVPPPAVGPDDVLVRVHNVASTIWTCLSVKVSLA